jgi:hypothetical protein
MRFSSAALRLLRAGARFNSCGINKVRLVVDQSSEKRASEQTITAPRDG